MGHSDLTPADTFRDQHLSRVRAYCVELCRPELVDEAIAAAFLDFRGRLHHAEHGESSDQLLVKASRSAAAARAAIRTVHESPPRPECGAMPELLAARANDELPGDDRVIRRHLSECIVCTTTFAQMRRAEQTLVSAPTVEMEAVEADAEAAVAVADGVEGEDEDEPEPEAEVGREAGAEPESRPEPEPAAGAEPESRPEPEPEPTTPTSTMPITRPDVSIRRRTGGLIGAMRRAARNALR